MYTLPKVLPINELKNTTNISKICKESDTPIIITKNGYSELGMMSIEVYEQTMAKLEAALKINMALKEEPSIDGKVFFSDVLNQYGK